MKTIADAHKELKCGLCGTFDFKVYDDFLFFDPEYNHYVCIANKEVAHEGLQYICTVEQFNNYKGDEMKTVIDAVNEQRGIWPYSNSSPEMFFGEKRVGTGYFGAWLDYPYGDGVIKVCNKKEFLKCVAEMANHAGRIEYVNYLGADKTLLKKENKVDYTSAEFWKDAPEGSISYASTSGIDCKYWLSDYGYSIVGKLGFYSLGKDTSDGSNYGLADFDVIATRPVIDTPLPTYTKAMQKSGEQAKAGSRVNLVFNGNESFEEVEIVVITDAYIIAKPGQFEQHYHKSSYSIKPIDTRTDTEKCGDDLDRLGYLSNVSLINSIKDGRIHSITFTGKS